MHVRHLLMGSGSELRPTDEGGDAVAAGCHEFELHLDVAKHAFVGIGEPAQLGLDIGAPRSEVVRADSDDQVVARAEVLVDAVAGQTGPLRDGPHVEGSDAVLEQDLPSGVEQGGMTQSAVFGNRRRIDPGHPRSVRTDRQSTCAAARHGAGLAAGPVARLFGSSDRQCRIRSPCRPCRHRAWPAPTSREHR